MAAVGRNVAETRPVLNRAAGQLGPKVGLQNLQLFTGQMCRFMSLRGPPVAGRGNLDRYIVDCFVVELLAMTPRTQVVWRERLQKCSLIADFFISDIRRCVLTEK